MNQRELESVACQPVRPAAVGFNPEAVLPYGCTIDHIRQAMDDFADFLGFINLELHGKGLPRLESFLMPANFSSMVGEFMSATIPKYCRGLVKNRCHNGHPDLIPPGVFPDDAVLHAMEGIEIKGSRHLRGWQGHNPEAVWLMVFVFDGNSSRDLGRNAAIRPFRFVKVVGSRLTKEDWTYSGRSKTSRRTPTASINRTGFEKMEHNWIYHDPPS